MSGLAPFSQRTFRSPSSSRFCHPTRTSAPGDSVSIICGAPSSSREERCVFCWAVIYQARRKRYRSLTAPRENQPLPRTQSFVSIFPIRETSSFSFLLANTILGSISNKYGRCRTWTTLPNGSSLLKNGLKSPQCRASNAREHSSTAGRGKKLISSLSATGSRLDSTASV